LSVAFAGLTYVANELGHNPPGNDEGYLYWLAWFAHNGASVTSTQDAHGAVLRGLGLVSCDTLRETPAIAPLIQLFTGPIGAC
jgi:phospholipid/cholesterol/gamma-HCH transport system substrate-binding protein